MNESFYVGAVGAGQCTKRLSVVANNLANINNNGFKPKSVAFSELIEYNVNDSEDAVTELQAGAGMRAIRTYTSFDVDAVTQTNSSLDFAITKKNTFFMLQDPYTGAISYTRDGHFHQAERADGFYMMTDDDKYVLDKNGQPIRTDGEEEMDMTQAIALVTFQNPSRLLSVSANEYVPADEGVQAIPVEEEALMKGFLETSGTDLAKEFTSVIECQRAYSYALRMVTTSDEIMSTINNLRG